MSTPRIALTGLGLITGAGDDVEKGWSSIAAGTSGIRTNTLMDTSELLTEWAGMVTGEQPADVDRCYGLAATAIREALESSGLDLDTVDRDRVAVVVGSSLGAMPTLESVHADLVHEGKLDAERAAAVQLPCVGDYIAAEFDLRGPRVVLSNACAASAVALGYAAELLWKGDVDHVICGGVDPLASLSAYGFSALGALDPEPCSPMSASTGLTLGEGPGSWSWSRRTAPPPGAPASSPNWAATASPATATTRQLPTRAARAPAPPWPRPWTRRD